MRRAARRCPWRRVIERYRAWLAGDSIVATLLSYVSLFAFADSAAVRCRTPLFFLARPPTQSRCVQLLGLAVTLVTAIVLSFILVMKLDDEHALRCPAALAVPDSGGACLTTRLPCHAGSRASER